MFILLIIKSVLIIIKQKIDIIVKKPYVKLWANNITLSILEKFSLEKIENNIKTDALFFHFLIKKVFGIKKVNIANDNKNIFITRSLAIKNREDC